MSEKIKDGGPAFPYPQHEMKGWNVSAGFTAPSVGMSLRDYFAGQVIATMCTPEVIFGIMKKMDGAAAAVAEQAYRVADAMLAARGAQ